MRALPPSRACVLLLAGFGASACGGGGSPAPHEGPQHPCADEPVMGELVADSLTIGFGGPDDFAPYVEGGTQTLVFGPQGGYMLTPTLRVDATRVKTDGHCPYLDLNATVDDQTPLKLHFRAPDVSAQDGYWYWEKLPLFLSLDPTSLVGRGCAVTAGFEDDGVGAAASVNVTLAQ